MNKAWKVIIAFCIFCVVLFYCGHEHHRLRLLTPIDSMIQPKSAAEMEGRATNIYFLKFGKAGSTTLYNIFSRYAWKWNLTVATYSDNPLGREQSLLVDNILPPFMENDSMKYNMILQHSTYEPEAIEKVLQSPIAHVTIMRNPLARLGSHLRFFHQIEPLNLEEERPAESFINKLDDMDWTEKNIKEVRHVVNYADRYLRIYTRGVDNVLLDLEKTFFVGITEFYDESLILLRHRLKWEFQDILYIPANVQNYKRKEFNRALYEKLCQWIPDECLIYEHFNKSLSQKIMQGNFSKEVKHFKSVKQKIQTFCKPVTMNSVCQKPFNRSKFLVVNKSEWHDQLIYTYTDCVNLIYSRVYPFRYLFYYRQNPRGPCGNFSPEDDTLDMRIFDYWKSTRDLETLKTKLICKNL